MAAGGACALRFFHRSSGLLAALRPGERLRCFGVVRGGPHGLEMIHPEIARLRKGAPVPLPDRLTPVYPAVEGVPQGRLRAIIARALELLPRDGSGEALPAALCRELGFPPLAEALRFVHHPPPGTSLAALAEGRHPALRRLAFEELLAQRLGMLLRRRRVRERTAPPLPAAAAAAAALARVLPFALTGAQRRAIAEIAADLVQPMPMLRLLHGDVGAGKTVVAAHAALQAILSGHQAALLAPTELLAEQHLATFRRWLEPLGHAPVWLAGRVQGRARREALAAIAEGAPLVIGTHALIQEGVRFRALGLVIIDEQHRFGVHQRLMLREKGREGERLPHQLVMTATPIPRTLAMTRFADLDLSALDEKPPGRRPVQTVLWPMRRRDELVARVGRYCREGRQGYWICTLVEESEQLAAQAAATVRAELAEALPDLRIGLVHGRMRPAEKAAAMADFAAGRLALLVATTVVEVGLDVPAATLMVIEDAERLGLAQLHQLRGRVGRGAERSFCVLLHREPLSATARARLLALRGTEDGFRLAEQDLELRGPGELLGTRQAGTAEFRIADLARDRELLPAVARVAERLLLEHPEAAARLVASWLGGAERYGEA
ncbi:MAG: ATP-dependent DNA helicase RecG [Xanthomonadales bacterium]|nr:ATP-dependent DNA helicase RecG [Xanthomonadales bacterium]